MSKWIQTQPAAPLGVAMVEEADHNTLDLSRGFPAFSRPITSLTFFPLSLVPLLQKCRFHACFIAETVNTLCAPRKQFLTPSRAAALAHLMIAIF